MKWQLFSRVRLCDPWTFQSMEFSRLEYWSGQPFLSPGDLPDPGIKPRLYITLAQFSVKGTEGWGWDWIASSLSVLLISPPSRNSHSAGLSRDSVATAAVILNLRKTVRFGEVTVFCFGDSFLFWWQLFVLVSSVKAHLFSIHFWSGNLWNIDRQWYPRLLLPERHSTDLLQWVSLLGTRGSPQFREATELAVNAVKRAGYQSCSSKQSFPN